MSETIKGKIKDNKAVGLALFAGIYVLAYALGFLVSRFADNLIIEMLVFDVSATVFIWAVSLVLHNSSLYDPYWSLTPAVMVLYVGVRNIGNLNLFHYIFIAAFLLWSVRLTANWVVTFENLKWEDWRYRKYRELPTPLWHLANFFGIMMIPTVFVFIGMIPPFFLLTGVATPLSLVGSAVILTGTALEFFADRQMHRFLRETTEKKTCRVGLWKYSRHPNYLGEILIWVGVYLALVCSQQSYWYLCGGIAVMIFLFTVISIPLAEKHHLARRPDYKEYRETTSGLLLLPNRK